jgi:hypothetical protein
MSSERTTGGTPVAAWLLVTLLLVLIVVAILYIAELFMSRESRDINIDRTELILLGDPSST